MYILKNTNFSKRDPECTNVVACTHDERHTPQQVDSSNWVPAGPTALAGLTQLWTQGGVTYYGHL